MTNAALWELKRSVGRAEAPRRFRVQTRSISRDWVELHPNERLWFKALASPGSQHVYMPSPLVQDELVGKLTELEELVSRGDLEEAREYLSGLERLAPNDERIRRFAQVLAPPVIAVSQHGTSQPRVQEYAWLREHAHEYPGCWLAVLGDRLIAYDPDVNVVMATIRQDPSARGALLHRQAEN